MPQDNNPRPGSEPDAPDGSVSTDGIPDPVPSSVPSPAAPTGPLTPGQRLAAKQAQKALDKREFREELKVRAEQDRQKEQVEADKLFGRPQPDAGLPANVEQVAGTFTDFLQRNRGRILGGLGAAIAIALVALGAQKLMRSGAAEQAALLGTALEISNAPIDKEDADGKTDDGKPVFKTPSERAQKALAAFAAAAKEGDDGAATWGLLGQAATEIELGKFDDAKQHFQAAYDAHKDSPVIAGRALEGVGLALEGAGKADEARATYEKLKTSTADKQLADLHLARLALAKGDQETGKTLLKSLYDELKSPVDGAPPSRYLRSEVEVRLAEIDSTLVTKQPQVFDPTSLGDPSQMSQEQIKKLIEQLQKGGATPDGAGE